MRLLKLVFPLFRDFLKFGLRPSACTKTLAFPTLTEPMLRKCANTACLNLFRSMHQGKLFQVATEPVSRDREGGRRPVAHLEHYWLCDECSPHFTLTFAGAGGLIVVPLISPGERRMPAHSNSAERSAPEARPKSPPSKGRPWASSR